MSDDGWMFRVTDAFHAHFHVDDGPSQPGIEWAIGMKNGETELQVWVRGLFAEDMSEEIRADHQYQANTCIGFLADQLGEGWEPQGGEQFMIVIANPT
ncbi:hypothetical protein D3874_15415 [Oleomonas cavernae]|uniref:Uncharacterized protein n=1 Tax=Oleomonas cavernae TaxID=2320859 RepID=A0A418WDY3_9PROT|nr:hypothetical protein [Oleomonas cavernae]RJF88232.1 hypothetical protein D3874_15415 [Oleomonas cavernae]